MYCRHCGMDSRNPSVCEWCKRPLAGGQAPLPPASPTPLDLTQPIPPALDLTQPVPPPAPGTGGRQVRVALTGEIVEAPPPAASTTSTYAPPPVGHYEAPGLPPSVMPARGLVRDLPLSAVGPHLLQPQIQAEQATAGEKWERCLAIVMPLLLASVYLVHYLPNAFTWVTLADVFLVGLAMGGTGAIEKCEEAYLDVMVVVLVGFFLGPIVALVVYGIVGLMKQDWNTAILFVLLGHIVVRLFLTIAQAAGADALSVLVQVGFPSVLGFFCVFASFAGWMLSTFFRPLNE